MVTLSWETAWMIPILVALIPVNAYPLVYMTRRWHSTGAGRALMVMSVGVAVVIDQAATAIFWGNDYPGRDQIRLAGLSVWAAATWWLFIVMVRVPRKEARHAGPEPKPDPMLPDPGRGREA